MFCVNGMITYPKTQFTTIESSSGINDKTIFTLLASEQPARLLFITFENRVDINK